jgi:hypothetical protein
MRCKSCLQIFSQPSQMTKETRICSICRGVKKVLKRPELCEKRIKILINRELTRRNFKKLSSICTNNDYQFIRETHQKLGYDLV